MSWDNYLQRLKEVRSYREKRGRKSGSGIERSLKWFLDTGPQKKGGYPKKRRPNFRRKRFNDISAPPGAPGGLEEVEEESFETHSQLQPDIWDGETLIPEIRERLVEIANDFLGKFDVSIEMEDLRLTGSLANYNWSKYSDIDLHIVVDFSKVDENVELVKAFFDQARMRWNDKHRILIHGFEVEIYVENIGEEHKSTGIYSLTEDEWIVKPSPESRDIDFETAQKKAQDYVERTQGIHKLIHEEEEYEKALARIDRVKEKIRDMRKVGLESEESEFSSENIAFKILRRDEILKKLNDLKYIAYDEMMTLKEE